MDAVRWQSLNRLLQVTSGLDLEDFRQLVQLLEQVLVSEHIYTKTMSSPHRSQEISWTNHQEELT